MRCGQCGRKLTEAALAMGYCPSCGNILPEGESLPLTATDHMLQQAAEQQSMIGIAPPVAPPRLSHPVAPPVMNAPMAPRYSHPIDVPNVRPAVGPSRPLVPPAITPAPPATVVVTHVQPQRANALLIALIVVVALILVAGSGLFVAGKNGAGPLAFLGAASNQSAPASATPLATATARPTATPVPTVPPAPPGFVTFYSQDRSFGLNYDQSWTPAGPTPDSGERGSSYNFSSPQQQFFQVTEAATTIAPVDITQFIQTFIASSNGTGFQMIGSVTNNTNGANTWTTAQGTYVSNGQSWSIIGLASNHAQHGYIAIYTAPASLYNTLPGSQFAEMVNSFTFL
jgi:hypothetical protein